MEGVVSGPGIQSCEGRSRARLSDWRRASCGRWWQGKAVGLWPEQPGPTPLRHQPLGRWQLAANRWAALRPTAIIHLAIERLQAMQVVKGGVAQSRSPVGTV